MSSKTERTPKRHRLTKMELFEVSLVDDPANASSRVTLWKRRDAASKPEEDSMSDDAKKLGDLPTRTSRFDLAKKVLTDALSKLDPRVRFEVIQTTLRRTMQERDEARVALGDIQTAMAENGGTGALQGANPAMTGASIKGSSSSARMIPTPFTSWLSSSAIRNPNTSSKINATIAKNNVLPNDSQKFGF